MFLQCKYPSHENQKSHRSISSCRKLCSRSPGTSAGLLWLTPNPHRKPWVSQRRGSRAHPPRHRSQNAAGLVNVRTPTLIKDSCDSSSSLHPSAFFQSQGAREALLTAHFEFQHISAPTETLKGSKSAGKGGIILTLYFKCNIKHSLPVLHSRSMRRIKKECLIICQEQ